MLADLVAAALYLAWALLRLPIPPLPTAAGDMLDALSISDLARRAVACCC